MAQAHKWFRLATNDSLEGDSGDAVPEMKTDVLKV